MTDIHALAGAYALDATNDIERAAFTRHLAGCEPCATEVAELRETAGRLADAAWTEPPPGLRASVLAEVARAPQLPAGTPQRGAAGTRPPEATSRWRRWAAASAAAVVLAGGTGAAVWVWMDQRVRDERDQLAESRKITEVVTAGDAWVRSTPVRNGRMTLVTAPSRNTAVVLLTELSDPGAGHAYQLWVIRDRVASSPGVLAAGARNGTVRIGDLAGVDAVAVSREPAGGSPQPTEKVGELPLA